MVGVVIFDAVSVPLLERMLAEGRLPALAELRARGHWHTVDSPATYFGDRSTAHTGVEVTAHGQTFPLQWSAEQQRLRDFESFAVPESLWERLARGGARSLVIDPYEGRRPTRPVGLAVSGWQFAHTAVLRRWSSPPRSYPTLSRRFGRSPEVEDVYGRPSVRGLETLRRQLLEAPARVARLAGAALSRHRYDLAWVEFSSGHLAGHHFWNLSHLDELDGGRREALERTLGESYAAIDTALGEIVGALPADADLLVFSEVGMDANHSCTDLLPEMLERVLTPKGTGTPRGEAAGELLWRFRAAVPARARLAATRALPNAVALEITGRLFMRGVDWATTRAFSLPADHDGYLRLNLRGREREGIVDPGDADALVEELSDGLLSFTDPDGTPCVSRVDQVADLFGRGMRSDQLPDLIVRWTQRSRMTLTGVTSPRHGDVMRHGLGIGRAGNHVDGSWLLAVPGAGRAQTTTRPVRLVDVAATAVHLLGADATGLAGEPLLAPR